MQILRRWLSAFSAVAGILALTACDPVFLGNAEAVSLMGTDKTVVDHVISMTSGKDCSTVRKQLGQTYCVEDAVQIRQNIYCYRELGGVTCYERPDPYASGKTQVDRNDHNMPK